MAEETKSTPVMTNKELASIMTNLSHIEGETLIKTTTRKITKVFIVYEAAPTKLGELLDECILLISERALEESNSNDDVLLAGKIVQTLENVRDRIKK